MTIVTDRLDLRDLVSHYTDAVNRRASAELAALWIPDGSWTVPGLGRVEGRQTIADTLTRMQSNYEFIYQTITSGWVDVDGDEARGTWYVDEFGRLTSGDGSFLIGKYDDRMTRTDEGWRFVSRDFTMLYLGKPEVAGKHYPGAAS